MQGGGGRALGLHPRLTNIQRIYNQGRAATVLNVGTLVRPTTRAQLNSTPLPRNLYSHSDQTQQWQSSNPDGGSTGWGGRISDLTAIASANAGSFPMGVSVNGGSTLQLNGVTSKGINLSSNNSLGLNRFGNGTAMDQRVAGLQQILTFDTGLQLVSAANGVLADTLRSAQEINNALASAPALPVTFPASGLGGQLAQVARIISIRGALGMNRQIFFAGIGGFDNHENLIANQDGLMATVDAAIGAFQSCMEAMTVSDSVTLFTESEFNRTGNSNANIGTDHAWGGHHFVVGAGVRGNTSYGVMPAHILRGPDDAGNRGNWIPTSSLDQYAATLGGWFGVSDADLRTVFPNLANFTPQRLGFL